MKRCRLLLREPAVWVTFAEKLIDMAVCVFLVRVTDACRSTTTLMAG
jgi:hypothetical protein